MKKNDYAHKVAKLMEILELKQWQFAEKVGASQPTVSRWRAGTRPDPDWADKIDDLWRTYSPALGENQAPSNVKVVGKIGAGQEIEPEYEQIPEDGLYEVDVPFFDAGPIGGQAIAFEVSGQSMWPRYDPGDLVICLPLERDPKDLIGREVALKTTEGRRYIKKLRSGSKPGLYNLESHNMDSIRDVGIAWASEVIHVARQGRFIRRQV